LVAPAVSHNNLLNMGLQAANFASTRDAAGQFYQTVSFTQSAGDAT
jgi:hypothetical protein